MQKVEISYGPPGHTGVTSIMGIGAEDFERTPMEDGVRTATYVAVGTWAVGFLVGSQDLKRLGFGGAVALLAAKMLAKRA